MAWGLGCCQAAPMGAGDWLAAGQTWVSPTPQTWVLPLTPPPPQASQVNDANKYAVTQAVVRVLAANRHPPRFAHPMYQAFVPAGAREAALLLTFGGHVLDLRAHDPDFPEVGDQWASGRGSGQGM